MSRFKAIKAESIDLFKDDVNTLLALPEDKINIIIELSRNGLEVVRAYEDRTEEELIERVYKACKIEEEIAHNIIRFFKNMILDLSKGEYLDRIINDLKFLGYKPKQIEKISAVINQLKKTGAPQKMISVKKRVMLSESVMPYLSAIECVHDYRYLIEEGKIQEKIPLLIMRLYLSSNDDEKHDELISFQMDIGTTKKIIEILNKRVKEFQLLEYK